MDLHANDAVINQRQESFLPQLLATLPLAACLFDAFGVLHQFNPAAAALLHLTSESIGKKEQELYLVIETIPGSAAQAQVVKLAQQDKLPFSVQITQQVVGGVLPGGNCIIKYYSLPTAQLAAQSWVKHIDNMPFAVIEWEAERVVYWSAQAENIFGWKANEALGKGWAELGLVAPDDALIAELQTKLSEGSRFEQRTHRNRKKDGGFVYCNWYNSALYNTAGGVTRVMTLVEDVTGKVLNEEQLRVSEAQLAEIYNTAHDFILLLHVVEDQLVIASVNRRFCEVSGLQEKDIVGKQLKEIPGALAAPENLKRCRSVLQTLKPATWSTQCNVASGVITGLASVAPIVKGGICTALILSVQDITALQEQSNQLEEVRQRLHNTIAHAQVAMAVYTGPELILTLVNKEMLQVLQKDESIVGKKLLEFLPELKEQPFPELLRNVLRTGKTHQEVEGRVMLYRNGRMEECYFDYSYAALPGPDGKPEAIIVTATEVTQRVLANRALRQKEMEVALTYDNTASALFLLELREGVPYFASVNKSLLATYGMKASQVIGKKCSDAMPLPPTAPMVLNLRRVMETGKPAQWSEERERDKGNPRSVNITLVPILDAEGRCQKVAGSIHDETQLKKQASELKQLNGELQRLTRHQQQVREEERRSIAREVHDELGQLLTALKIDLFWCRQNIFKDPNGTAQKLDAALQVADTTINTVRRVVADLHPMVLHDLGLVAALQWQMQQFGQKTGLEVHFSYQKNLQEPSTNTGLSLFRIGQEALTNVLRHAQARQVDISLSAQNGMLELRISDDGRGFDPVQKGNDSFGLIGMKERAGNCGGTLQVISAANLGTTIIAVVPEKGIIDE